MRGQSKIKQDRREETKRREVGKRLEDSQRYYIQYLLGFLEDSFRILLEFF